MKKLKTVLCVCVLLILAVTYYLFLPALNPASLGFVMFLLFAMFLFSCVHSATWYMSDENKYHGWPWAVTGVAVGLIILLSVIFSPLFMAKTYAGIMSVPAKTDISDYTPTIHTVPLMDRDTAELLMNRTLGTLVDEVSQFELDDSTQINFRGKAIRVSPLKYGNIFKWFGNRDTGIPSYLTVDMQTQKAEIHELEQGMKYSPSAFFGYDLIRHLRFHDLTAMFGDPVFELDESGAPLWVVPKLTHKAGLFFGTDVVGVYVVEPVSGDIAYYDVEDVPSYIDNVYPASLIIDQYDWYGGYQSGFWNSVIGQRGVTATTDGYNYIPQDDDVYLYTGITSVGRDESNIGFLYVDLRTKEARYFEQAGAEEFSAMSSAEGVVQHLGYTATFPLLLNIEGQPTYCMALKDAGGLVKMYGLVNVEQYQIVVTGDNIAQCVREYRTKLLDNGQDIAGQEEVDVVGVIEELRTANMNGSTYFYLLVNGVWYELKMEDNKAAVLLDVGDSVKLTASNEPVDGIVSARLI